MPLNLPISPLTPITNHPGTNRGISLFIKRDDLLHPEIQGSKGRKLSALFPMIQQSFPGGIVTFGGAFSNHLHAVATAGRIFGIPTTGLIRGEHIDLQNPTLRYCQENGMTLHGLPKPKYDHFKQPGNQDLSSEFPTAYLLPEGGNTPQAVAACMAIPIEIAAQLPPEQAGQPYYLCTPAGTGCTAAGIVAGLTIPNSRVLIFPVSSHGLDLKTISDLLPDDNKVASRFELVHNYTFGGFAKLNLEVMALARTFSNKPTYCSILFIPPKCFLAYLISWPKVILQRVVRWLFCTQVVCKVGRVSVPDMERQDRFTIESLKTRALGQNSPFIFVLKDTGRFF